MSVAIRFGIVAWVLLAACGGEDTTDDGAPARRGGRAGATASGGRSGGAGTTTSVGGAAGAGGNTAAVGAGAAGSVAAQGGGGGVGGAGGVGASAGFSGGSGASGNASTGSSGQGGPGPGTHALAFSRGAFALQVPPATAGPMPLAILLHGQGDTGQNFLQGWLAGAFGNDLLLAAPDDNHEDVPTLLLDHLAALYDVDLSRVYVVGHSQGGAYAAFLLFEPALVDRFAGVLLNSSGLAENPAGIPAATPGSPAVAVCIDAKDPNNTGSLDGSTDFKIMEQFAASMKAKGYDTKLTLHGKGHTLPQPELAESFTWLRTHAK